MLLDGLDADAQFRGGFLVVALQIAA
jgi:hypothetical protein